MDKIIGRNPVLEAVRANRNFEKLVVQRNAAGSIQKILDEARERDIQIRFEEKESLDRLAGGGNHQGVVAIVSEYKYCELEDIIDAAIASGEDPLILVLDGIEDPHNLGAILRTAECAGVHGVIIPRRRSAGLGDTVAKVSSGAVEYVRVAQVTNITNTVKRLKELGVWVAALDMEGESYFTKELTGGMAVVVGGEGKGIGRLVKENCDFTVSIPMSGHLASLNASNAAAVVVYEIKRQRAANIAFRG
ncbi:MAG: 23S rRNA (guanosine(2251)-2'-O)-methyltransferase RlmB [Clostridiales Family XIII bacterium]|jgi:23S rRNA (guanosine2251-2'-O)-methyltransferase|nr:23S rRNA (guanosine(2251)-2'-O)-methyltransferase RlmB [Clostridiales Family XIII bacterium]